MRTQIGTVIDGDLQGLTLRLGSLEIVHDMPELFQEHGAAPRAGYHHAVNG